MQFHFKSDEGEQGETRPLPRHDLHGFGSPFEFLVKPLDDICGPERNPFLFRTIEQSQAGIEGLLQTLHSGSELRFPFRLELREKFECFLSGRRMEDRAHPV